MRPETVIIETDNGPVMINRADFDENTMTLANMNEVGAPAVPSEMQTIVPPPANEQPGQEPNGQPVNETLLVTKRDKKFVVVNADQVAIERDGIEKDGYKTEADAWAAIMALAPVNNA